LQNYKACQIGKITKLVKSEKLQSLSNRKIANLVKSQNYKSYQISKLQSLSNRKITNLVKSQNYKACQTSKLRNCKIAKLQRTGVHVVITVFGEKMSFFLKTVLS
jgi:hypothetical protein